MQGRKGETLSRFCPKLRKTARDKKRDKKFAGIWGGGIGVRMAFRPAENEGLTKRGIMV